eukprot:3193168-Prymnesium_polylepis.1
MTQTTRPVPLIIDTDMSFDVDDVGAVCIAHALMARGEAELLAVMHSSGYPEGIGAASVLSEWYNHSDSVKLGAYMGSFGGHHDGRWIKGRYGDLRRAKPAPSRARELTDPRNFHSPVTTRGQVPDAVDAYREVLSHAEDASVVIAVIGFATNIAPLLRSPPDEYSSLNGVDLVARKVKLVVWQGGWYPHGGTTYNWDCGGCCGYDTRRDGCVGRAAEALQYMPATVEQIFTDVGDEIYHGGARLRACAPVESPCRQAFIDHHWGLDGGNTDVAREYARRHGWPPGRQSWDPIAVLVAVRGPAAASCTKSQEGGTNRVNGHGTNFWTPPNSTHLTNQSFLALDRPDGTKYEARLAASSAIDDLLCEQPPEHRAPPTPPYP